MEELNTITEKIIGCAIEVHKQLGPGLLESVYEKAMCVELELNDLKYKCQLQKTLTYKDRGIGIYKIDLIVEDKVIVELKSDRTY